ncbi:MAG TPA: glycosyl hydrolase [Gemmatimonadaceae bacterium]|nr:glycosyl hydrolase [Gemmatimonadaceae bacterium]
MSAIRTLSAVARATAALAIVVVPSGASAQRAGRAASTSASSTVPPYNPRLYSDPTATNKAFKSLRWRLIGPFRGGRVDAVAGDPTKPLVYYMGAVNGGVWKTTNAGISWENITDGKTDISSVGAVTVAPSDPNVIYVGTGESQLREDLTYGTGVYRSTDAGETWQHLGLVETHQVTAIRVHPNNPDVAYVAAIGHAFGPNAERGVFRTMDGGKSWKKILFLDDSTGATDLSMDPTNPRILYASMWKFQRSPWGMDAGGGKSGLWKSTDGGDTWVDLSGNRGMPKAPLGKIGIAVSPANPRRLFASIEAKDTLGGIFRSDDAGATWSRTNGEQKFQVRPWYYSAVTADPTNENTVYVMNLQVWRSIDGGKTFSRLRVPHGDTHIMWVDPKDPTRLINGNDGGATVSQDGGRSWSSIYNQPTSQFYHVITDNQWPYRLYGAQQDNSAITIASRSDFGSIGERDWWSVAGCENAHIAVDPRDPSITYGGCYTGMLMRHDNRTQQTRDIAVWLNNYDGIPASDVPNRFQWTFPVLLSPHDPTILYATSQHVWRSTNEGRSWDRISPDLTYADPATLGPTGGPVHKDMTGTEWYATIYAFAESPRAKGELWTGSDDGRVHLSRDGGATWSDVTPKAMVKHTRITGIEPSPHDPAVAYLSATRYQLDDFRPYFYKTTDYGKSWTRIDNGIPMGAYARSLREDPIRRGLLFAATEIGVWVSLDDGANWQPLQLNLPRASVRDLRVHENDIVVATHGRSFWALDDIAVIRQLHDSVTAKPLHLFQPSTAWRFAGGHGGRGGTSGENPYDGVLVDYWVGTPPTDKLTLEFVDPRGTVVRSFSSATKRDSTAKAPVDSMAYVASDSIVTTRPGTNRFFWNLRYPNAKEIKTVVNDMGTLAGPTVVPGDFRVRLIAGKDTLVRPFTVKLDPRVQATTADLQQTFDLGMKVRGRLGDIVDAFARIEDLQQQIDVRVTQSSEQAYAQRVKDAAKPVRDQLEVVRTELVDWFNHDDQATLHFPIKLYNMMLSLNSQVLGQDAAPTKQHGEILNELGGKVDVQLQRLQQLEVTEIKKLNALLQELGLPPVFVPPTTGKTIS